MAFSPYNNDLSLFRCCIATVQAQNTIRKNTFENKLLREGNLLLAVSQDWSS